MCEGIKTQQSSAGVPPTETMALSAVLDEAKTLDNPPLAVT